MRDKIIEVMARPMTRFARRDALEAAEQALSALEASGMTVVPVEPTEAMLRCEPYESQFPPGTSESVKQTWRDEYGKIWAAMLAAHTQEKDA